MLEETNDQVYQLKSNLPQCLVKGCDRDTYGGSRGLCTGHFSTMLIRIKKGVTTWDELERCGLAKQKITKEERERRRLLQSTLKRVWSPELRQFIYLKILNDGSTVYPSNLVPKPEIEKKEKNKFGRDKCILKYCNAPVKGGGHGLCKVHYLQERRRVKIGVTTWEALELAGLAKNHGSYQGRENI